MNSSTKNNAAGTDTVNDTNNSPWRSLLAGAAAGAFSKTVIAPLERIKLLLQLEGGSGSSSIRHLIAQVYQQEGLIGFWRGNTPSVVQKAGNSALNFYLMDYYKLVITNIMTLLYGKENTNNSNHVRSMQIANSLLSGGLSGATTTTLLYPLEFLRTRLAVDIAKESSSSSSTKRKHHVRQFGGMFDVVLHTFQTDGILGMYRGYAPSIVYVAMHRVVYLGGFDIMKREVLEYKQQQHQHDQTSSLSMMERVCIAQGVSLLAATVCYPLDTVRRQLMMQAGRKDKQFTNVWECTRYLYTTNGISVFFRGLGANLAKTVGGALLLVAYDSFRSVL